MKDGNDWIIIFILVSQVWACRVWRFTAGWTHLCPQDFTHSLSVCFWEGGTITCFGELGEKCWLDFCLWTHPLGAHGSLQSISFSVESQSSQIHCVRIIKPSCRSHTFHMQRAHTRHDFFFFEKRLTWAPGPLCRSHGCSTMRCCHLATTGQHCSPLPRFLQLISWKLKSAVAFSLSAADTFAVFAHKTTYTSARTRKCVQSLSLSLWIHS